MKDAVDLLALAQASQAGDRSALEALVVALQRVIHPLALRMTGHPADAEDATQEILIKIITRLDSFRGDASPVTWAHRIAVNHLLDRRKSRVEEMHLTFQRFGDDLLEGLAAPSAPVDPVTEQAVKHACTLAMLTCLDRAHRAAYILGDVFDLSGHDASHVLDVSRAVFRQRLSRARRRLHAFTTEHCGLVRSSAACRCVVQAPRALATDRVTGARLVSAAAVQKAVDEMERLHTAADLMRWEPEPPDAATAVAAVRKLIASTPLGLGPPHA